MRYFKHLSIFFFLSVSFCFSYRTSVGLLIDQIQKELDQESFKNLSDQHDLELTLSNQLIVATSQEVIVNSEVQPQQTIENQDDFKESNKKEWLFLVYIAGQNNLHKFVKTNLKSMSDVGSSKNMHVVCQVDELGKNEITRVQVHKKKVSILEEHAPTEEYISGTQESLYHCIDWAVEHFPTQKICLILWGHGSGAIDPHMWDRNWLFDRSEEVLFNFNETTGLLELRHPFTEGNKEQELERGIGFNEEHATYLTNADLAEVLEQAQEKILGGKKIDILAFDACLMGMVEVATQVQDFVKYMVASEEIVPGHGFPYNLLLEPFSSYTMSAKDFALYFTTCYAKSYVDVFADFTLSALCMDSILSLKMAINDCAQSLLRLIDSEYGEEIFEMLFAVRASRKMTTPFYNRDYIDLMHTLLSIQEKVGRFKKLEDIYDEVVFLQTSISQVQVLMKEVVLSSVHGVNPIHASGLSIYWPRSSVHSSYKNLLFNESTQWRKLLRKYVAQTK